MRTIALLAAAGSLAALSAPAAAAELPTPAAPYAPVVMSVAGSSDYHDPPRHAPAWGRRGKGKHHYERYERYDDDRYDDYDRRDRYRERRLSRRDRIWRGRDGQYYCSRSDGTTGLVIGAGLGALAGRAIDTRGDRTLGTILGAIGGGLLGREIDRGELRCR